jgi:hypothetical protein
MTVTPAYGRDYKSKAAALADWNAGLDVWIRYSRLTKIVKAD